MCRQRKISIILISAGIAILLFLIGSFVFYRINAHIDSSNFDNLVATINEESENTTSSQNNNNNNSEKSKESKNENNASKSDENNNSVSHIDVDALYKDSIAYNEKLKDTQSDKLTSAQAYTNAVLDLRKYGIYNNIYGYVSAPSIGMELPIYLGASDSNMSFGAAHLGYTSLPTGGDGNNVTLSGHTGYVGRWLFDDIPRLAIGDRVTIKNYFGNVNYNVVKKVIRTPDDSQDIFIKKGKDLLTLVTCTPNGSGGFDRYVVICEKEK